MSKTLTRRSLTVLAASIVVPLGVAVAATHSGSASCEARPGSTLLDNGNARVFRLSGRVYACSRPVGPAFLLFKQDTPDTLSQTSITTIRLGARFVAWKQSGPNANSLYVLDLQHGNYRQVASLVTFKQTLGEYVLNSRGTVVWIKEFQSCAGGICIRQDDVYKNTRQANSTLEEKTNQRTGGSNPPAPIRSLGLSDSGSVAYWITNGLFRGAQIQ